MEPAMVWGLEEMAKVAPVLVEKENRQAQRTPQCRSKECSDSVLPRRNETLMDCRVQAISVPCTLKFCKNPRHQCCRKCRLSSPSCRCSVRVQKATTDIHHTRPNSLADGFRRPCTSSLWNASRKLKFVLDPISSNNLTCSQKTHYPCCNQKYGCALRHTLSGIYPSGQEQLACMPPLGNPSCCKAYQSRR